MEKFCIKCKQVKPISEFGKDRNRPDGLFPYCKRCRLVNPEKSDEWRENTNKGLYHCTDCKQWLPITSFTLNPHNKNGVHGQCKICSSERAKQYYHADKERAYQINKKRYWDNRDKERANYKQWYNINAEKQKAKSRKWHKENYHRVRNQRLEYLKKWTKEKGKKWAREYYHTPQGYFNIAKAYHTRRARMKNVENTLTKEEWNKILESQDYTCLACGKKFSDKLRPSMDHIIPLSKGGGLTKENTQALCRSCNSKKHTQIIDYRQQ